MLFVVLNLVEYQKNKITDKEQFEKITKPFEEDDEGNKNILVIIDNFSKYVELFPIKEMDTFTT